MMTAAASIGKLIDATCLQAVLRGHEPEVVAQRSSGFGAHGNSGHVTADTVGKRVDGMGIFVGVSGMAGQTLPGPCPHSLELSRR